MGERFRSAGWARRLTALDFLILLEVIAAFKGGQLGQTGVMVPIHHPYRQMKSMTQNDRPL